MPQQINTERRAAAPARTSLNIGIEEPSALLYQRGPVNYLPARINPSKAQSDSFPGKSTQEAVNRPSLGIRRSPLFLPAPCSDFFWHPERPGLQQVQALLPSPCRSAHLKSDCMEWRPGDINHAPGVFGRPRGPKIWNHEKQRKLGLSESRGKRVAVDKHRKGCLLASNVKNKSIKSIMN